MYDTISLRIKKVVTELFNGNKSEFARKVGISESGVRSYLTGTLPRIDVIEKIAKRIGLSCEWLVLGKGEMYTYSISNKKVLDDVIIEDKLLAIIKAKDDRVEDLARTIGRLEAELSASKKLLL